MTSQSAQPMQGIGRQRQVVTFCPAPETLHRLSTEPTSSSSGRASTSVWARFPVQGSLSCERLRRLRKSVEIQRMLFGVIRTTSLCPRHLVLQWSGGEQPASVPAPLFHGLELCSAAGGAELSAPRGAAELGASVPRPFEMPEVSCVLGPLLVEGEECPRPASPAVRRFPSSDLRWTRGPSSPVWC